MNIDIVPVPAMKENLIRLLFFIQVLQFDDGNDILYTIYGRQRSDVQSHCIPEIVIKTAANTKPQT